MNEILKAIHDRRTIRDFKPDQQISDDHLQTILEAGHQAPSAWNRQPWHFTVVTKQSLLNRIEDVARGAITKVSPEQVEKMPWLVAPGFHYFYEAPTVVFVSGNPKIDSAQGDCAIACLNMVYAAHSLGIQSCVIVTALAAFTTDQGPGFVADLEIPEGYEPMYAMSFGYSSKPIPSAAPRKEDFLNYIK